MRAHFLVGVVGEREGSVAPPETADFVFDWSPKIIIAIRFCPFCGARIDPTRETLRVPKTGD